MRGQRDGRRAKDALLDEAPRRRFGAIHHDGFMEKRKREHEIEIVSSGPVMGGWHITLSCVETGEETWRFDLKMDCSSLGVRNEGDLVEIHAGI